MKIELTGPIVFGELDTEKAVMRCVPTKPPVDVDLTIADNENSTNFRFATIRFRGMSIDDQKLFAAEIARRWNACETKL